MRIGIDIDDTLTDIREEVIKQAFIYAEELGKDIESIKLKLNNNKEGNIYSEIFGFNYDEKDYFLRNIQEKITDNVKPRSGAVDVIKKLKENNHEIYIITGRKKEFHDDPYLQSKKWLDKNNVYYDKLIVDAGNKKDVCLEEEIDLFIDDLLDNCLAVSNIGVDVIRFSDKKHDKFNNYTNWEDIYKYITEKE